MREPIRQVISDGDKEQRVANKLCKLLGWDAYKTPPYFPVDYLVNSLQDPNKPKGYANFIGSLEIKWINGKSDMVVKFPYQKLQKMWLLEPLITDSPNAYNRICIRYVDGLLLIPASKLRTLEPVYELTRADTGEHDFNVHIKASDYPDNFMKVVVL